MCFEKATIFKSCRDDLTCERQHQCGVGIRPDRPPFSRKPIRQVVAQGRNEHNPHAAVTHLLQVIFKLVARQAFVTVGRRSGEMVEIVKGLKAGDRVVIAGQNRLSNGTPVKPDNSVAPLDAGADSE